MIATALIVTLSVSTNAFAFIIVYGDGTAENPKRISTCAQLHSYLNEMPGEVLFNQHFLLTNNLDCTGYTFNNFTVLSNSSIDGGNHRITNLNIGEYGFVYILDASTIKNLWLASGNNSGAAYFFGGSFANQMKDGSTLENVKSSLNLNCDGFCGGLAGTAQDSTITKSVYDGTLNAGSYSGGLVGSDLSQPTSNLTITKSAFRGTISSPAYGGGIVGSYVNNTNIIDSYVDGTIDVGVYGGGIIGSFNDTITISNSYSAGTGVFSGYSGGIIGGNSNNNVSVLHSFTTLNSYNSESNVGNVEGRFNTNSVYSEVYYLDESGQGRCQAGSSSSISGCNSMTLGQADLIATYLGFDLTHTWQQEVGKQPTLRLTDFSDPAGIPNSGDMNDDGILDTFQGNVELLKNNSGNWTAIETKDSNSCTVGDASLLNTTGIPKYSGFTFSSDFADFNVYCPDAGQSFTVNIYLDRNIDTSKAQLLFYNPTTKTFTKISGATFSHKTIGGQTFTVLSYTLTDGGPYDQDGTSNGKIEDPTVLVLPQATSGVSNNVSGNITPVSWSYNGDLTSSTNTESSASIQTSNDTTSHSSNQNSANTTAEKSSDGGPMKFFSDNILWILVLSVGVVLLVFVLIQKLRTNPNAH